VSGSTAPPVVDLLGTSMSALVHAIPAIIARTGRPVIVIGGLAVLCRLTRPYRVTTDLDTVTRRSEHEPAQLELLLDSGAEPGGVSGALVATRAGQVQVDVLEVTDDELTNLPEDPTDRLHVLSHAWAAATATPVIIRADDMAELTVAVGQPGPLIAMKLQSVMNRGATKEATDLLDIIRLTLDPTAGPMSRSELETTEPQLRCDAALHATYWFDQHAERSLRLIRAIPEGRDTTLDDLRLVGELLHSALTSMPNTLDIRADDEPLKHGCGSRVVRHLPVPGVRRSDVTGVSSRRILEALIAGERDPRVLAELSTRQSPCQDHRAGPCAGRRVHRAPRADVPALPRRDRPPGPARRGPGHPRGRHRHHAGPRSGPGQPRHHPRHRAAAAEIVIAETGGDMDLFQTAGHLASWIGVCPGMNESAGVNKSGHTRHGTPTPRVLRTAAMAAIKRKDCSELR